MVQVEGTRTMRPPYRTWVEEFRKDYVACALCHNRRCGPSYLYTNGTPYQRYIDGIDEKGVHLLEPIAFLCSFHYHVISG